MAKLAVSHRLVGEADETVLSDGGCRGGHEGFPKAPSRKADFTGSIPGPLLRLLNYDLRRLHKSLFQTKGYFDDIFHASSLLMVPCWLLASRRASPACWR